jgi:hypothetical protein
MLTVRSVVARIRMILFPLGLRHNPGHAPPRACAIGEPSSCRRCHTVSRSAAILRKYAVITQAVASEA